MVEAATHYPLRSHSHDLVDLTLFDVVVNEYGVTSFTLQSQESGIK
jgi:hypothetical protein